MKTLIEKRTSDVFWNKVVVLIWLLNVNVHAFSLYEFGENYHWYNIFYLYFVIMFFLDSTYKLYKSIQVLKLLKRCFKELEECIDDYFKDSSRD